MSAHVYVYHVQVQTKKTKRCPGIELQGVWGTVWVLGTESGSSRGAASAPNH